jgi:hypothetical protein
MMVSFILDSGVYRGMHRRLIFSKKDALLLMVFKIIIVRFKINY